MVSRLTDAKRSSLLTWNIEQRAIILRKSESSAKRVVVVLDRGYGGRGFCLEHVEVG
jgi:hypothetical protein